MKNLPEDEREKVDIDLDSPLPGWASKYNSQAEERVADDELSMFRKAQQAT